MTTETEALTAVVACLVETTWLLRKTYRDGSMDQIAKLVEAKPDSVHGWRLRSERALEQASAFVEIPAEPVATWVDYFVEPYVPEVEL